MNDQDMNEMIEFLRNKTSLGRLNHGEVREVMRVLQEEHYTLEKKTPAHQSVVLHNSDLPPLPLEKPVDPAFDISKPEGHDVTV